MGLTSFNREDAAINGNTTGDFRKSSTALSLIAGVNQAQRFALIGAVELFMNFKPKEYTELPKLIPVGPRDFALVDAADYEAVAKHHWNCSGGRYALHMVNGVKVLMHRFIMNPSEEQQIDHINHNGLDNRRINLRVATQAQNMANSSPRQACGDRAVTSAFKGVSWRSDRHRWTAYIGNSAKRQRWMLGCFDSEIKAAIAYNKAAVFRYGEFACLNVINHDGQTPEEIYGVDPQSTSCPTCNRPLSR